MRSTAIKGFGSGLTVSSGGQAFDTNDAGFLTVRDGGTATNTTLSGNGSLMADPGGTLNGVTAGGSTSLVFENNVAATGLSLALNSSLDLYGLRYTPTTTAKLNATTNVLTLSNDTSSVALQLTGSYAGGSFTTKPDDGLYNLGSFYGTLVMVSYAGSPSGSSVTVTGNNNTTRVDSGTVTTPIGAPATRWSSASALRPCSRGAPTPSTAVLERVR